MKKKSIDKFHIHEILYHFKIFSYLIHFAVTWISRNLLGQGLENKESRLRF